MPLALMLLWSIMVITFLNEQFILFLLFHCLNFFIFQIICRLSKLLLEVTLLTNYKLKNQRNPHHYHYSPMQAVHVLGLVLDILLHGSTFSEGHMSPDVTPEK